MRSAALEAVFALEQANLNAWPAAGTLWDGAWCLRITPDVSSRRINSLNMFDPWDDTRAAERIAAMCGRFERLGRVPTFRLTPLFSQTVRSQLLDMGFAAVAETIVMTRPVGAAAGPPREAAPAGLPVTSTDPERWLRHHAAVDPDAREKGGALAATIARILPQTAALSILDEGEPVATALAVADRDYVGLLLVAVAAAHRRRGHGGALLRSALAFGAECGARLAWLQVEADNAPAIALYRRAGFTECFRYGYRVGGTGA